MTAADKVKKFYYRFHLSKKHFRYYLGYRFLTEGAKRYVQMGDKRLGVTSFDRLVPRGDRIHILCSGPSVKEIRNQQAIFSHPVLAMNGSHELCRGEGARIDYYVVSDIGFVRRNWESFSAGVEKSRMLLFDHRVVAEALRIDPRVFDGKDLSVYDLSNRPYNRKLDRNFPCFSTDAEQGFNPSKTVAFLALQLGVAIGYREVVFLGFDLNSQPRFYSESSLEKTMIDQDYSLILADFLEAAKACSAMGIRVINASPESRLPEEVFPKRDPDAVLSA